MSYLGNTPTTQNFISGTDYFNGTGAQTAFTLSRTVASVNDIQVTVNNVVQQPNDAYTLSGTTLTMTSAPSAGTNNVYVRYLSTTTQVITPSQNTVSWNTLDTNTQQDLGISFKNRIINGNMVIDQRNAGASVSVDGTEVYTLDRWKAIDSTDGVFSVQQDSSAPAGFNNSLKVTVTTADASIGATQYAMVRQVIEGFNFADLGFGTANAKTVTLSFWVKSSLTGAFGGCLWNSNGGSPRCYPYSYTINAANTWEQKTVTIVGDASGTWVGATNGAAATVDFTLAMGSTYTNTANAWYGSLALAPTGLTQVMSTLGATLYITGVQLEVGTQATTFTLAGGSYGAELALCQRYFWKTDGSIGLPSIGAGMAISTTNARINIQNPVSMRATPTYAYSGTLYILRSDSGGEQITSLAATYAGYLSSMVQFGVASGLVAGNGTLAICDNASSNYFTATAEL